MKKAFLLLIVVTAVTGILWFNVSASSGPSIEVVVHSEFFADVNAGSHVQAGLYTAEENLEELPCLAMEHPGFVSCQVPEAYAGEQRLPLALTRNGIMYVSLVDVPAQ
jgi:hypothetical protein